MTDLTRLKKCREKITSATSFYFLNKNIKKSILSRRVEDLPSYHNYLTKFMLTFYEKFFNLKTFIKIKFLKNIYECYEEHLQKAYFFKKYRKYRRRIGKGFFYLESFKVVLLTLMLKDCRFFLN